MDQKLVDRLRRTAMVGMVSLLCAGSPAWAGNGHGNGHGQPNCPGKSCDSHGKKNRKDLCTTDADCADGTGCRNGKCHKNICLTDADCDAGFGCHNNKCHKDVCSTDADCDTGETCSNGKCHNGSDDPKSTDDGGLPTPAEICGDCIDNDGNGLTDFEDPACCSETQEFAMTLSNGMIKPAGETSKLRLRSLLMGTGMTSISPTTQDVLVQLRPADGKDIFCARIPATAFVRHQSNFKFVARRTPTVSAKGLDRVMVNIRHNGTVRFRTLGKRVQLTSVAQGRMQLTLGFIDAANPAANRCSSTTTPFQNVRQLTLIA